MSGNGNGTMSGYYGSAGVENLKKQPIESVLSKREEAQRSVVAYIRSEDRRGGLASSASEYTIDLFSAQLFSQATYRSQEALINVHSFAFTGTVTPAPLGGLQAVLAAAGVKQILLCSDMSISNVVQTWTQNTGVSAPGAVLSNVIATVPAARSEGYLLDNQPLPVLASNPMTSTRFYLFNQDGIPLDRLVPTAFLPLLEHHITLKVEFLG
jgi:hypothetical protein